MLTDYQLNHLNNGITMKSPKGQSGNGLGYATEFIFGVGRNCSKGRDHEDFELKSITAGCSNMTTMKCCEPEIVEDRVFNYNREPKKPRAIYSAPRHLVENYGSLDTETNRIGFMIDVTCGKPTIFNGVTFDLKLDDTRFAFRADGRDIAVWDLSPDSEVMKDMKEKFDHSLRSVVGIAAPVEGCKKNTHYYSFHSVTDYSDFCMTSLLAAIADGTITLSFRVYAVEQSGRCIFKFKPRNHGTAFRILDEDWGRVYKNKVVVWSRDAINTQLNTGCQVTSQLASQAETTRVTA